METRGRITCRRGAALIMLLVMSFIISNRIFYVHTHRDSHGNIVTHSHPYNKGSEKVPVKSHHHPNAVLALLASADQAVLELASDQLTIPDRQAEKICDTYFTSYTIPPFTCNPNRGPPVI